MQNYLTEKEAVKYIGLCRDTLMKARNEGKLTYRTIGRKIIYKEIDLDNFIERNSDLYLSSEDYAIKFKNKKI